MLKLSQANFIKARDFILTNADDISRSWFRYHFKDGDASNVMNILATYQHECGGFGGLSDEFEYQGSCLKCTEIAIGYILGLSERPPHDHPVIKNTMPMKKCALQRFGSLISPNQTPTTCICHAFRRITLPTPW